MNISVTFPVFILRLRISVLFFTEWCFLIWNWIFFVLLCGSSGRPLNISQPTWSEILRNENVAADWSDKFLFDLKHFYHWLDQMKRGFHPLFYNISCIIRDRKIGDLIDDRDLYWLKWLMFSSPTNTELIITNTFPLPGRWYLFSLLLWSSWCFQIEKN